jgi:hypothetical protein
MKQIRIVRSSGIDYSPDENSIKSSVPFGPAVAGAGTGPMREGGVKVMNDNGNHE